MCAQSKRWMSHLRSHMISVYLYSYTSLILITGRLFLHRLPSNTYTLGPVSRAVCCCTVLLCGGRGSYAWTRDIIHGLLLSYVVFRRRRPRRKYPHWDNMRSYIAFHSRSGHNSSSLPASQSVAPSKPSEGCVRCGSNVDLVVQSESAFVVTGH